MDGTSILIDDLTNPFEVLQYNLEVKQNYKNVILSNLASEKCKSNACIVGIDEAGRGPVLGPMVYGICYCVKDDEVVLKQLGCADSKSLDELKREQIFELLCKETDSLGWAIDIISPNRISNLMLKRQKCSLNEISHTSAMNLIKLILEAGVNVTEVFVDTVGPPEKYQEKLSKVFPDIKIVVSKKADSIYPIVSAASICAKVTRDLALKTWKFNENITITGENGWGSGYPNDPITKRFLVDNLDNVFGFPQIVRFSWSTASKILTDSAISVNWSDDEDDTTPAGNMSIKSFFKKPGTEIPRHRFFAERCLTSTQRL